MTAAAYLQQLNALLPSGWLWNTLRADPVAQGLLGAVADELAAIDQRAGNVLDEADPRTVYEMLPEWEEWLGLPDACSGQLESIVARRAAVLYRLRAAGGQGPAYFVQLAAALGYTVTITEYAPRRCGAEMGTDFGGIDWQTVFDVVVQLADTGGARLCGNPCGEAFGTVIDSALECAIRRAARADRHPRFIYQEA
ncbi:MAG: putative phage tail protein [Pseudomonadota bacterium]